MPEDTASFIAFATHADVCNLFIDGKPLVAVSARTGSIVWSNAAGARFFGHETTSGLAKAGPAANLIAFRQFKATAFSLHKGYTKKPFTIHVLRRFGRQAVSAMAIHLTVDNADYIVFECDQTADNSRALIEGFAADEAHLALVDGDGTLLDTSENFNRIGIEQPVLADMCHHLSNSGAGMTERLVTTDSGIWPLALGRLRDDPALYLLFASEEITDIITKDGYIPPQADKFEMEPRQERPAREVIARLDEALGAIDQQNDEISEKAETPLIRRVTPEERQAPATVKNTAPKEARLVRRPVRFVWRTDTAGRFTEVSHELAEAVGSQVSDIIGMRFQELETRLGVKGGQAIEKLVLTAGTWSGRTVEWPLAGTDLFVPVDLAALPTYTRERFFEGFRGFGLVRLGEEKQASPQALRKVGAETEEAGLPPLRQTDQRNQLNEDERRALGEIASRLKAMDADLEDRPEYETTPDAPERPRSPILRKTTISTPIDETDDKAGTQAAEKVDAMNAPVLVQSGEDVLHVNPAFLAFSGYGSRTAIVDAGGADALIALDRDEQLFLVTADDSRIPVTIHLQTIIWQSGHALAMTVRPDQRDGEDLNLPGASNTHSQIKPENESHPDEISDLRTILETAADGIIIIRQDRTIRSLSASALALFGIDSEQAEGMKLSALFAEESWRELEDRINTLSSTGRSTMIPEGLEAIGRESGGGLIPVFMTLGRMPKSGEICAVLRDITGWKQREDELRFARRNARQAAEERDLFLATLRHELRQPLDAIVSLSDTMFNETFGPLGDDHYHALAREISSKSRKAREAINRLLGEPDAAPVEDLTPRISGTHLNEAIAEAVSLIQPGANARRVIVRTALSPALGDTVGDAETLKKIATELIDEAVNGAPSGGQVIVSTASNAEGETVIRLRDNGTGSGSAHPLSTSRKGAVAEKGETPRLTNIRHMTEHLSGRLAIHTLANEGTLVEVFFKTPNTLAKPDHEQ